MTHMPYKYINRVSSLLFLQIIKKSFIFCFLDIWHKIGTIPHEIGTVLLFPRK